MLIKLKPDVHSVKQQDQQGAAAEERLKGRGSAWPGQQLQIVFYSKCNISYSLMHNWKARKAEQ